MPGGVCATFSLHSFLTVQQLFTAEVADSKPMRGLCRSNARRTSMNHVCLRVNLRLLIPRDDMQPDPNACTEDKIITLFLVGSSHVALTCVYVSDTYLFFILVGSSKLFTAAALRSMASVDSCAKRRSPLDTSSQTCCFSGIYGAWCRF